MTYVVLEPSELLDPHGFDDGRLCAPVLAALAASEGQSTPTGSVGDGRYNSPRHLLRHLIRAHLLPMFPWASEMVIHKDPEGSPAYLWLYDDDGCPRRSCAEEVRSADSVTLDLATLRAAVERVYPLRTAAQVHLYEAIGLPLHFHEVALELIRPFGGLDDDVLRLAGEIYAVSYAGLDRCCLPEDGEFRAVLAERLSAAVLAARSLLA